MHKLVQKISPELVSHVELTIRPHDTFLAVRRDSRWFQITTPPCTGPNISFAPPRASNSSHGAPSRYLVCCSMQSRGLLWRLLRMQHKHLHWSQGQIIFDRNEFKMYSTGARLNRNYTRNFRTTILCAMWESSQLSLLEIPLRTSVKGKIRFPQ
jgi:hypothetical protein